MFDLQCSGCGQKLRAADDLAGQSLNCPKCGQAVTIPDSPQPPLPPLSQLSSTTRKRSEPCFSLGRCGCEIGAYVSLIIWLGSYLVAEAPSGILFAAFAVWVVAMQAARCRDVLKDIRTILQDENRKP